MASDVTPNQVLETLENADGPLLTAHAFPSVPFVKIKSTMDILKSRDMIQYTQVEREEALLTPEAEAIAESGSHEAKVFEAVRQAMDGLKINELPVCW